MTAGSGIEEVLKVAVRLPASSREVPVSVSVKVNCPQIRGVTINVSIPVNSDLRIREGKVVVAKDVFWSLENPKFFMAYC
jgi:hypothetical protein